MLNCRVWFSLQLYCTGLTNLPQRIHTHTLIALCQCLFSCLSFILCSFFKSFLFCHISQKSKPWMIVVAVSVFLDQSVGWSLHHCGPDWNSSLTFGCIALKFWTDVDVPQSMSFSDFSDSLWRHSKVKDFYYPIKYLIIYLMDWQKSLRWTFRSLLVSKCLHANVLS